MTRYSFERWRTTSSTTASREFNSFINSLGLIEINSANKRFTCTNFCKEASLAKLDRSFVSIEWHNQHPLTTLNPMVRTTFDHTPLLFSFTANL
ncbi:Retrotransposon protein, putative, unclassified [Cocos nucifera]|nr:Retrotransposon protein, putative, unclassified [Cocos nucifera]